ncbi:MAG: helix-turn-helix domain-containing protein [Clostridiales bacterium]|nr:helix-turn-helix domain-containing protein [Clostridiales bacterium]
MTRAERQKMWKARVAEYRASGQSVREWSAANNVNPGQLWYWLRKYTINEENIPSEKSPQWLPVEVNEQSRTMDNDNLVLIRVGEASIEVKPGFDPALLSDVVRALTSC